MGGAPAMPIKFLSGPRWVSRRLNPSYGLELRQSRNSDFDRHGKTPEPSLPGFSHLAIVDGRHQLWE